jgi:hypothetical protein
MVYFCQADPKSYNKVKRVGKPSRLASKIKKALVLLLNNTLVIKQLVVFTKYANLKPNQKLNSLLHYLFTPPSTTPL